MLAMAHLLQNSRDTNPLHPVFSGPTAGSWSLSQLLSQRPQTFSMDLRSRHEEISLPIPKRVSAMLSPLTFFLGTLRQHLQWDLLSTERRGLAERMLADFHLVDKLDSDPQSFSEGEKRKAYLIMCLLKDADLYVLDEPLMAVDENSKNLVMQWVFRCSEGRMLLVIMHGDLQFHGRFQRIIELSKQRSQQRYSGPLAATDYSPPPFAGALQKV